MLTARQFSLDKPRHDQSTYVGRVRHFFSVVDPRTLFASKEEVAAAKLLLEHFRVGSLSETVTDEQLWEARKLCESVLHPDTKEAIFPAFRMAAFVPMNVPIAAGMLLSAPTLANVVFWQWFNQSFNAAFNYANRPIGRDDKDSASEIAKAYASATTISVALAVGLNRVTAHVRTGPVGKLLLQKTVPFVAVAAAGAFNALLMRQDQARNGVMVKDAAGAEYGRSKVAGRRAISQVMLTRVALPLPVLLLPPFFLAGLQSAGAMPRNPRLRLLLELVVCTGFIWGALPAAVGIFPQNASIGADELEPEFRDLHDASGRVIDTFYFNKGV